MRTISIHPISIRGKIDRTFTITRPRSCYRLRLTARFDAGPARRRPRIGLLNLLPEDKLSLTAVRWRV